MVDFCKRLKLFKRSILRDGGDIGLFFYTSPQCLGNTFSYSLAEQLYESFVEFKLVGSLS